MKTVHIGNVRNSLMIERFTAVHSTPLRNASARKVWLAREGDIVVTQRPVSADLKAHMRRVTGLAGDGVTFITAGDDLDDLAGEISRLAGGAELEIEPYALERWVAALAHRVGGRIRGYDDAPSPGLIDLIYRLNTKSGFREAAGGLDIALPEGRAARGAERLEEACRGMLRQCPSVIVKLDRSSNGYGNLVLGQSDIAELPARLARHFAGFAGQGDCYMVEEFLAFDALPSVEMTATGDGLRLDYICDQRVEPKAGMATPPAGLAPHTLSALQDAGAVFGSWLRAEGYRGVFDVDGGMLAGGDMVFTETNTRRTAGSHLNDIARRLLGPSFLHDRVWLSGHVGLATARPLSALEARLKEAGLLYDRVARTGVILPVDHVAGERCYYQIFAASMEEAEDMEQRLHRKVCQ